MNYNHTLDYLQTLNSYGIVPGLDSMYRLCARLGNPQDKIKVIHIAGTNGKGSVLALISTILKEAGYRTGRYISPAIFEYRESIQINGRSLTKKDLCSYTERVKAACEELTAQGFPHPTAFEFETAMAFLYFAEKECDIVVLETGMGGILDATNVIKSPVAAVLASVSMDHMKFLGSTLQEIALCKAGIIKEGCVVISTEQAAEVMEVFVRTGTGKHADFRMAEAQKASQITYGLEKQSFDYGNYKKLEIGLAGKHQIANAVLAIETIRGLETKGYSIKEGALRKGLRNTVWAGRFSVLDKDPLFIADGAHNEDAAQKLADSIRFYFTNRRIVYIIGMLKDKEYEKVLAQTYAYADQIITVTPPENPRALPALELALVAKQFHPNVTAAGSLEEAIEMAYLLADRKDVILSFGSLSYLGRLMTIIENRKQSGDRKGKKR